MKSLYEQFRPRTWDELVGQDKLIAKMAVLRRRGLVGRVFWVTGDSGTGKSTVARLIAGEIADDYAVVEMDAQDVGLAHNHPSGDPTPSDKDEVLTARLIDCGKMLDIPITDHVVIGQGNEYWSMRERFNNDHCHRPALDNSGW